MDLRSLFHIWTTTNKCKRKKRNKRKETGLRVVYHITIFFFAQNKTSSLLRCYMLFLIRLHFILFFFSVSDIRVFKYIILNVNYEYLILATGLHSIRSHFECVNTQFCCALRFDMYVLSVYLYFFFLYSGSKWVSCCISIK